MSQTVVIVAALITIGVTALLIGVLERLNGPRREKRRERSGDSGGLTHVHGGATGRHPRQEGDNGSDGGGDGD